MKFFDKVKEAICSHQKYTFMGKRPIGTQAIKFEWLYKCTKCGHDLVQDHPRQ
jgi:hypothetical protein